MRAARSFLFALTLLGTLSPQAADRPTPAALAAVIARFHRGDPLALAELRRQADASCAALLADLDRQVAAADWPAVQQTLRAIDALGVLDERVLARLDATIAPAPDAVRVLILRVIGDLVLEVVDRDLIEAWMEGVPVESNRAQIEQSLRQSFEQAVIANPQGRRWQAMSELGRIRVRLQAAETKDPKELTALVDGLDVDVAELAAEQLGRCGTAAAPAIEALARLMRSNPRQYSVFYWQTAGRPADERIPYGSLVRMPSQAPLTAALALVKLAPDSEHAVEAHQVIVRSGRPDQQLDSLVAMRSRALAKDLGVANLLPLLKPDHHRLLRREALITLGTLGPDGAGALPAIASIESGPDPELAAFARAARAAIGSR